MRNVKYIKVKSMKYSVKLLQKQIKARVTLPASKSINNRLLVIQALSHERFGIKNISSSDDARVMLTALSNTTGLIDIGHAGTAMRFLTAYYAITRGKLILTGSERMKERPISILVDALRELGADIQYAGKEGYPPLEINGKMLEGGTIEIDGSISSQYISALLMVAPKLKNGLTMVLKNRITSMPYIVLTLNLMKHFGIKYSWRDNVISIAHQEYSSATYLHENKRYAFWIEADWSAASYWYQIAALSPQAEITIYGLTNHSLQGDAVTADLFAMLGVETHYFEEGVHLRKKEIALDSSGFHFNFIENPDLAQTFAVTLCMMGIPFHFTGLETLKIKETDRIAALQTELKQLGFLIDEPAHGELSWTPTSICQPVHNPAIKTYDDHRMAMAFAPVAILRNEIVIDNPNVVTKSYPEFWNDLKDAGFSIDKC